MTLETTTETAQALHEAHIMLTTSDMTTSLFLLLTPSSLSLGLLWILGRVVRLYVLVHLMTKLFGHVVCRRGTVTLLSTCSTTWQEVEMVESWEWEGGRFCRFTNKHGECVGTRHKCIKCFVPTHATFCGSETSEEMVICNMCKARNTMSLSKSFRNHNYFYIAAPQE